LYNEIKRKQTEIPVYREERHQAIVSLLQSHGRVSVADLSDRFSVSQVTIRVDLQALVDQGSVVRTHGGAILAGYGIQDLSLLRRRQRQVAEKARIAAAAAELVGDGEAIFLDSSSTTLAILSHIRQRHDLTVMTNSLVVAQELLAFPKITVVMPGGTLHHDTVSLIDAGGLKIVERYNISKGFFGAHGLTLEDGFTDVSEAEARLKRSIVGMCRQVIALLDATKWGRAGVASFAEAKDADVLIADAAPEEMVCQMRALGVEVNCVGQFGRGKDYEAI
jgi:DeoR/GlpR family transcriptional regulator of sugar metabolism